LSFKESTDFFVISKIQKKKRERLKKTNKKKNREINRSMQCQKKKMAPCIDFVFMAFGLLLLLIAVTTSRPITRPKVFDVRSYGAKGDGKMDNTNVNDIFCFL